MSADSATMDFTVLDFSTTRRDGDGSQNGEGWWESALNRAMQRTLDAFLVDEDSRPDPLESTFLLGSLHQIAKAAATSSEDDPPGPWTSFQNLRLLVDFQLVRRRFSSLTYASLPLVGQSVGGVSRVEDVVNIASDEQVIRDLMSKLVQADRALDMRALKGEVVERLDFVGEPGSPAASEDRSDLFRELVIPLIGHLDQAHLRRTSETVEGWRPVVQGTVAEVAVVDQLHTAPILRWIELLENEYSSSKRLRAYPFTGIRKIDDCHVVVVVTPLLAEFVDEKVAKEDRIANITLAVFRSGTSGCFRSGEIEGCSAMLRLAAGHTVSAVSSHRHQLALSRSAGESTQISRYWLGEGLVSFIAAAESSAKGLLAQEDALDFWQRFIEELLCAKVAGVEGTETFPFDRAFLFNSTGSRDQGEEILKVRVLEAGLMSTHPKKRGYKTSLEREQEGIPDYQILFTDKQIRETKDFSIVSDADGVYLVTDDGSGRRTLLVDLQTLRSSRVDEEEMQVRPINHKVAALLRVNVPVEGSDRENEVQEIIASVQESFDEIGISYQYQHGVDLQANLPAVHWLNRAYLESRISLAAIGSAGGHGKGGALAAGAVQAKVVHIAFDPAMIRRAEYSNLLGEDHCTILLVADKDQEKGVTELNAERADLRQLVEMVVRQRLQGRRREEDVLEQRVSLVREALSSFVHNLNTYSQQQNSSASQAAIDARALQEGIEPILSMRSELRKKMEQVTLSDTRSVIDLLLPRDATRTDEPEEPGKRLEEVVNRRLAHIGLSRSSPDDRASRLRIGLLETIIPPLELSIPSGIVRESFLVMLNNAVEAAVADENPADPEVKVQVLARPRDVALAEGRASSHQASAPWVLEIVVENTSAPVPGWLIGKLNQPRPERVNPNSNKRISTGIGVATHRRLLQLCLGQGADIGFVRSGPHHILARMTLPARLPQDRSDAVLEPANPVEAAPGNGQPFVLFVEDDREMGKASFEALQEWLAPRGWHVEWCRGKQRAAALARNRTPKLVLMDMSIAQDESDDMDDRRHGLDLLTALLELLGREGSPPLWLVSNDSPLDLRTAVSGLADTVTRSGYRVSEGDHGAITEPGTLALLSNCKPIERHGFVKEAVEAVASRLSPSPVPAREPAGDASPLSVPWVETVLDTRRFDEDVSKWTARRYDEGRPVVLVARARTNTRAEMLDAVRSWMLLPGAPDPDSLSSPEENRRFCDPLWHKNAVLGLSTQAAVFGSLPAALLFGFLRRNIWIGARAQEPSKEIAERWQRLQKAPNGVFATIRHDVKSLFAGREPTREALAILAAVNALDQRVRPAEVENFLAALAHSKSGAEAEGLLKDLSRTLGSSTARERKELGRSTRELALQIARFAESLPAPKQQRWMRHRDSLDLVADLFGDQGGAQ